MVATNNSHTQKYYNFFNAAFEVYNEHLFDGALPSVIITVTRKNNVGAHFSPNLWKNIEGESIHEISVNPAMFGSNSLIQVLSVIVREMVHLWNYVEKGKERKGYHGKDWVAKMDAIGLNTQSHDKDRKNGTGQKVSHSIDKNGQFAKVTLQLEEILGYASTDPDILEMEIEILDSEQQILSTGELIESNIGSGDLSNESEAEGSEATTLETGVERKFDVSSKVKPGFESIQPKGYEGEIETVDDMLETGLVSMSGNRAEWAEDDVNRNGFGQSSKPVKRYFDDNALGQDVKKAKEEFKGALREKPEPKKGSKRKYSCACEKPNNIWGKTALSIKCNECNADFKEQ